MKKNEIVVGGFYAAKVGTNITTVRVDAIREHDNRLGFSNSKYTVYDVTNMRTGRKTTFRSAAKFRSRAVDPAMVNLTAQVMRDNPPPPPPAVIAEEYTIDEDGNEVEGEQSLPPIAISATTLAPIQKTLQDKPIVVTAVEPSLGDNVRTIKDSYFKDDGTGRTYISGLPLPIEKDGVVRGIKFVSCSFHPQCGDVKFHDCQFVNCDVGFDIGANCERCSFDGQGSDGTKVETAREERNDLLASELAVQNDLLGKVTNKTMVISSMDATLADPKVMEACRAIYDPPTYSIEERQLPLTGLAAKLAKASAIPPHIIVEARAGTGKTFTIMVGVAYTFRDKVPGLWQTLVEKLGFDPVPSEQQKAVWDAMALSADAKTIQMTAFNKSIVTEFETKWSWLIQMLRGAGITLRFATNHSMGFAAVRSAYTRKLAVSEYRVIDLIATILNKDIRELRKTKIEMIRATEELVGLCKMNLTEPTEVSLEKLLSYYDVEMNGYRREVFDLVPKVLDKCKDPTFDGRIDYDDMIWLPCVLDLSIQQSDLLLVDECQDLNRCQQALAKKAGRRIVMVGDPKQAIYGFAGADAESISRMTTELGQASQGCVVLPLTVTRRCGHAIVAEANQIVPDFQAHETNHPGQVSDAKYPTYERDDQTIERPWEEQYLSQVRPGDFILCRVNAPLVNNCFRLLKRGIKANIQGRDIGTGLITTINKLDAADVKDLIGKVSDWLASETVKENAKRLPSETRLIALQDRADCLIAFTEGQTTVQGVIDRIKTIFSDSGYGVKLSSVHKAKGLEADRVFIIEPKGATMPHPMARTAWQQDQEMNLRYVAITRAIKHLVWVA